jgi:A/G-specific adenine glycosylase
MTFARQIRRRLLAWFDASRRDLPWREAAPDPYRVWLSEIMLQQTTVAHAEPYWRAFVARWPTIADLADAADAEVMAAWAGLGYYARARNLLACARAVARGHGGVFPDTEAGLRALPGVGAYTAAAVAAIVFRRPANVVDANVERVVARLFAVETPLPAAKGELGRLAAGLVADERPGDWAQALMDLGAVVCRPRAPLCAKCPIAAHCGARATGSPDLWPRRAEKAPRPRRHGAAFVLVRGAEVALHERPGRGLLGGMLGLPTTDWRGRPWTDAEILPLAPTGANWRKIGEIEHVFTHFSLSLAIFRGDFAADCENWRWTGLAEAVAATPSLFRKALQALS